MRFSQFSLSNLAKSHFFCNFAPKLLAMRKNIIGRAEEIRRLENYAGSPRSEFIAIYGRRRVGKTFLVKELFEGQFAFRMTGKENVNTEEQLENFHDALQHFTVQPECPRTWSDAFSMLAHYVETVKDKGAKILFFDELSWLDTRGSHFVTALEHFWNDWAAYRNDIKLIACGSAATWMLDKVINARGGLHNRVTHQMLISPFTLNETEKYFQAMDFPYERQEIMECYMALGGVAYYLSLFEHEKSVAQNIESLCFTRGGELTDEFKKVFKSLFKKAENHVAVMTALSKRGMGMTRQELIEAARQTNNGNLTKLLRELEECAFIRSYVPFGKAKKNMLYQLIDPFTLFHFRFMADGRNFLKGYWQKMQATAQYMNWCGYAFEVVCLNHLDQIVHALGIDGTINKPCAWSYRPSATEQDEDLCHGAQIDLLIDRSDKSISICEMKYTQDEYEITKDYFDRLQQRMRTFRKATKTKKTLIPTFVTPNGLVSNMYARRMARTVTSDGLFEVV